jgi:SAM-dependent methyltransferase
MRTTMKNEQQMFDCRLCGHVAIRKEWGGGECPTCGSVSVASVPTEEQLDRFYQSYNDMYEGGGGSGGRNQIRYATRYLRFVTRYAGPGELIDVGSSTNPFPNVAATAGFSVTVMDYARPRELDPQVRFVAGNINDDSSLATLGRTYDVVTAWAVLEHTPDPRRAFKALAGLCRPGGFMFLSTPEIGTALTRNSIGWSGWFYPPEHLNLISPTAIKAICVENGCELLEWGRVELNFLRYAARYGVGLIESIAGLCVLRGKRIQKFQGITYFVLRKLGTGSDGPR